jgi:CheY-like chemotaxis protein
MQQNRYILVVDDDPDILEFLQALLEDTGYTVHTAEKSDGLEQLQRGEPVPAVIILDMLLSGKDGREVVKQLKGREHTRAIPIIMTSAHPSAEQTAYAAGADDFLAKPFDLDDLLVKIARYIQ